MAKKDTKKKPAGKKRRPNPPVDRITAKVVQSTENKPVELPHIDINPEVDDDPWDGDGLTHKQRLFVEAYVGPAAGNATKAAQLAGYRDDNRESLTVTASLVLRKTNVQRAISRRMARAGVTRTKIRDTIASLATADMSAFLTIDSKGREVIDLKRATEAAALGHIREISQDAHEVDGTAVTVVTTKVKLHDPAPYLALLVKILGMGKPRKVLHQHAGADGKGPIESTVTHKFDHDAFRDQFRRLRTGGVVPSAVPGTSEPDRN